MIIRHARKFKGRGQEHRGWSLERIGIAVAIAVGIATAMTSVFATLYAGQQAELGRQALSASERNAAFVKHVEAMSAYCDALDFSNGRAEMNWTFSRQPLLYTVLAYYKDIGTQHQTDAVLTTARAKLHELDASAISLHIWLDLPSVDFIERTLHELKGDFFRSITKNDGRAKPARVYVMARAKCLGTREVLIAWYRNMTFWPLESAAQGVKVRLATLPLFR